jgi:hypothetical protein
VGPRAVLDAVVERKIPSPRRESKPRTLIVQPIAQRYTTELSQLWIYAYFLYVVSSADTDIAMSQSPASEF